MYVIVTDQHNHLIACIDTDGGKSILVNGTKHFIAPSDKNVTFIENKNGILAYPQIVLSE